MKAGQRIAVSSKKQVLTTPKSEWPRPDAQLLTMKQIGRDKRTGSKVFSFVKSYEYKSLQKEFDQVQATMDI